MITQLDPAYVNFSFTTAEYRAFRELNQQRKQPIKSEDLTVELQYGDGSVYPLKGRIDIAEQQVDLQTGTIEARAIFPNPDGAILPGQFVRAAVQGVTLPDVIVIPERAISQGPQGPFVFVIEPSDTAQARLVRLGQEVATGFVVRDGLLPGDRVVVDGVIRVRPGAPVNAVPADLARQRQQQASPSKPAAATGDPTEAGGARP
jgi:membrane fusion protein (multidrug efflux system)